jgi:AraC family transcriptional regulator
MGEGQQFDVSSPVPSVLHRVMKNFRSDIVISFKLEELDEKVLIGFYVTVDLNDSDIQNKVRKEGLQFLETLKPEGDFNSYAVFFIDADSLQNGMITAFFGIDQVGNAAKSQWHKLRIPAALFAGFRYKGDLINIGNIVIKDLQRWMKISKIELSKMPYSFIQAYDYSYTYDEFFTLYLPIRKIPQRMLR